MSNPRILDFFCGAGGFSEGFRQQGFRCVKGYDNWRPAVQSHNLNHGLQDEVSNILDFEGRDLVSAQRIEADDLSWVPDTEVIVGSPPCVSFSMSNKAGKADKSLGLRLIEAYLRVVAIKKHKHGSILKAWLMENVPNSRNFVRPQYRFMDLGLASWAKARGLRPSDVALSVQNNGGILVAADYGSPQKRARFVCGEWVKTGEFPAPLKSLKGQRSLREIRRAMPPPLLSSRSRKQFQDPSYPGIRLGAQELTDHFYDTGVYQIEWRNARYLKQNHPFMGMMSFPENEANPSRTIMATRSASTREAILYQSEYGRLGDGEYRLPTIREAATLMGFPWYYQFEGSEGTKWKQIGNAVCPHMSAALAARIRKLLGLQKKSRPAFSGLKGLKPKVNLNAFCEKEFDRPPRKKVGGKFRRHPFKVGNMTIALTNYMPGIGETSDGEPGKAWYAVAFLGSGKSYKVQVLNEANADVAARLIFETLGKRKTQQFFKKLESSYLSAVPEGRIFQELLSGKVHQNGFCHPAKLIDDFTEFLADYDPDNKWISAHGGGVVDKPDIPLRQVLAVIALAAVVRKALPGHWKKLSASKSSRAQSGIVQKELWGNA